MNEGHAEKKMFSNAISMSSNVNQDQLFFLYPHWLSSGQKGCEYENFLYKDMPIYALNFLILAHLAPQWRDAEF